VKNSHVAFEHMEIIRRICDRGLELSLSQDERFVDVFQHIKDELARLRGCLRDTSTT